MSHEHHHDHEHGEHCDHPHHHHDHHHPHDHNHPHDADHLHSHMHHHDEAADLQVLAAQFIDGFVKAADKTSYLKLAGVPFERPGQGGAKALKLVDVELTTDWQVGTASPSWPTTPVSTAASRGTVALDSTIGSAIFRTRAWVIAAAPVLILSSGRPRCHPPR